MELQRLTREARVGVSVAVVLVVSLGLCLVLWSHAQSGFAPGPQTLTPGCASRVCWLLVIIGIIGTTLAARGRRFGWLLLFGLQPIWITYAVCTDQSGLILGSVAYGAAQLNGFLRGSATNESSSPSEVDNHGPCPASNCPPHAECVTFV